MIAIDLKRFDELTARLKGIKILVIGDIMLDQYYWGEVDRISPEAPVPVVTIDSESIRLGGAGNVLTNVLGLQAEPVIIGVVGEDAAAGQCMEILEELQISHQGIIGDSERPTTVKSRIIANNQHVVRADRECEQGISQQIEEKVLWVLNQLKDQVEAIIVQDYNKGLITPTVISTICQLGETDGKIITVDPKYHNFFSYHHVTVFKPNQREVETALNIPIQSEEDLIKAGQEILTRLSSQNVLITRGAKGMMLIETNGDVKLVSTKAKEVADVSGAGDTVISTLTLYLAAGATIVEAATLANYAAGVVCGEVGVVPVTVKRLRGAIEEGTA